MFLCIYVYVSPVSGINVTSISNKDSEPGSAILGMRAASLPHIKWPWAIWSNRSFGHFVYTWIWACQNGGGALSFRCRTNPFAPDPNSSQEQVEHLDATLENKSISFLRITSTLPEPPDKSFESQGAEEDTARF